MNFWVRVCGHPSHRAHQSNGTNTFTTLCCVHEPDACTYLAVEVVDVDVPWNGHLPRCQRLEQAGFTAAILANEAISPAAHTSVISLAVA